MKLKLCTLAAVVLIAWGMKRHYADANADDLWWILGPTASLVALATGSTFVMIPAEGYVSHERLFVIEKACAGVNFLIVAFVMLVLALLHRVRSGTSGAALVAASAFIGYTAAIVVNTARIAIGMWLAEHPLDSPFNAAQVHRFEGIVVYFGALLLIHELARWLDGRQKWIGLRSC